MSAEASRACRASFPSGIFPRQSALGAPRTALYCKRSPLAPRGRGAGVRGRLSAGSRRQTELSSDSLCATKSALARRPFSGTFSSPQPCPPRLEKQEESHGFSRIATDRKEEERRQTKAPLGLKKDLAARHRFAVGAMSGSVRRRGVLFSRKERAWGVYGECLPSRFPSRLDGASGQVANSAGLATWKWPAWPVGHLAIWPLHLPGRVNGRVVQIDMNGAGLGRALHKLPQQPEKEQ
jgi:hypothetical protein